MVVDGGRVVQGLTAPAYLSTRAFCGSFFFRWAFSDRVTRLQDICGWLRINAYYRAVARSKFLQNSWGCFSCCLHSCHFRAVLFVTCFWTFQELRSFLVFFEEKQGLTRHRPIAHPVVFRYPSYSPMFGEHAIHCLRRCPAFGRAETCLFLSVQWNHQWATLQQGGHMTNIGAMVKTWEFSAILGAFGTL